LIYQGVRESYIGRLRESLIMSNEGAVTIGILGIATPLLIQGVNILDAGSGEATPLLA
jgi:hypothetical protein